MKKILYLCNRLPNNENAGGILYNDIIKTYGIENFSVISVSSKIKITDYQKDYLNLPHKQLALRLPNTNIIFKILKRIPLFEPILLFIKKPFITREIIKFVKQQNCDLIFAGLRGDVLLVLDDLIKEVKLPLYAMVEDTVERENDDHKIIYKKLTTEYYKLIPKVKRLAVAGETMQEYFKANFKIDSIITRPSYINYSSNPIKKIGETLNIFFSGNLYAQKEMDSFLNALPLFKKNNPELNINVYIASHRRINFKSPQINIINLGWIAEEKLIEYMKKCHISYLPYKSEPEFMHSMKYAFPAKAGFYLTNNLPIFFHGPAYSSFNTFLEKYQVGVSCDSMSDSIITTTLEHFINDPEFYSICQKECFRAYNNEFNIKIFNERVFQLFYN